MYLDMSLSLSCLSVFLPADGLGNGDRGPGAKG